jgi:hypothetical protein
MGFLKDSVKKRANKKRALIEKIHVNEYVSGVNRALAAKHSDITLMNGPGRYTEMLPTKVPLDINTSRMKTLRSGDIREKRIRGLTLDRKISNIDEANREFLRQNGIIASDSARFIEPLIEEENRAYKIKLEASKKPRLSIQEKERLESEAKVHLDRTNSLKNNLNTFARESSMSSIMERSIEQAPKKKGLLQRLFG